MKRSNCDLFLDRVKKANRQLFLIEELQKELPNFMPEIRRNVKMDLKDIQELSLDAGAQMMLDKKCPFVDNCLCCLISTVKEEIAHRKCRTPGGVVRILEDIAARKQLMTPGEGERIQ